VAHRLDPVGIDGLHLLDEAENPVQFGLRGLGSAFGEFESGELGDVADFVEGE
jgi:hypothetical protein